MGGATARVALASGGVTPDATICVIRQQSPRTGWDFPLHPLILRVEVFIDSNISMTMDTYSHMLASMQQAMMKGLNELFNNGKDTENDEDEGEKDQGDKQEK